MTGDASRPGTPPTGEVPPYCRACRRALHQHISPAGVVTFIHAVDLRGATSDHPAQPVPLSQVRPGDGVRLLLPHRPPWVYVCADQQTDSRVVMARTVGLRDYRNRHHAARTRGVETKPGLLQTWGQRWSACDGCAALIENRDLYGLISRVTDAMPAKYTRGKRLLQVRGELHANYSTVFATLRPGRGRITSDHPLGVWEPTEASQPNSSQPDPGADPPAYTAATEHRP